MHAAQVLSLHRKHSLEQRRRSRLASGLPNGDLSLVGANSPPWYQDKWEERRSAFASAKNAKGLSLFHMFAVIAFLGVGFMITSMFLTSVPGLLEIGVTAFLISLFCLIFVRCDAKVPVDEEEPMDDLIVQTRHDTESTNKSLESPDTSELSDSERTEISARSALTRSSPQKIPSPIRGYALNFSPIMEVSEPSSCASSFLTKVYEVSKLAKSNTNDSLGSKSSSIGGKISAATAGSSASGRSPIHEELEEMLAAHGHNNNNGSSNSASFDTDDDSISMTADLSVMTVIERKNLTLQRQDTDLDVDQSELGVEPEAGETTPTADILGEMELGPFP